MKKLFQAVWIWLKVNGWDLVLSLALVVCLIILGASIKQGVSVHPPDMGDKGTSRYLNPIVGEQAIIAALEKSMSAGATVNVGMLRYYNYEPGETESTLVKRLEWINAALKNVKSGPNPTIIAFSAHALYNSWATPRDSNRILYPAEYEAKLEALKNKVTITVKDVITWQDRENNSCGLIAKSASSLLVPFGCTSPSTDQYINFYYAGILQKASSDLQSRDSEIQDALATYNRELSYYKANPRRYPDDYQTFRSYASDLIRQKIDKLIYIDTNDPYIMDQFKDKKPGTQD